MKNRPAALLLGVILQTFLPATVAAQNSTARDSDAGDGIVGWQAGPTNRGTLSLLYSCLITIFASTWTVLHLNVPGRNDSTWRKIAKKAKWMWITILLPEFIFAKAICELRLALHDLSEFEMMIKKDFPHGFRSGRNINPEDEREESVWIWKWHIEYGRVVRFLYRLMRLPQPPPLIEEENSAEENMAAFEEEQQGSISGGGSSDGGGGRSSQSSSSNEDESVNQSVASTSTPELQRTAAAKQQHPERDPEVSDALPSNDADEKAVHKQEDGPMSSTEGEEGGKESHLPEEYAREGEGVGDEANRVNDPAAEGQLAVPGSASPPPPSSETKRTIYKHSILQRWTLTHAYLANMGGLLHVEGFDEKPVAKDTEYYTLTGAKLSRQYGWYGAEHPLCGLILSNEDISDKSKADWLLKAISISQITWLLLTVLARGVLGLPVTQLEIATAAFSVFAVATYIANMWKPKDISQPILLQGRAVGDSKRNGRDRTQSAIRRLTAPAATRERESRIRDAGQVHDDEIWMPEDNVPMVVYIMAGSAFVFGGLHCLAWNFESPSRAELLLWRTTSVASAVVPVLSLIASVALGHAATVYADKLALSWLVSKLSCVEKFPPGYLELLQTPVFKDWGWHNMVVMMPRPVVGSRKFDAQPTDEETKQAREEMERTGTWDRYLVARMHIANFTSSLQPLFQLLKRAKDSTYDPALLSDMLGYRSTLIDMFPKEAQDFWDDYEESYVRHQAFETGGGEIPRIKYVSYVMATLDQFPAELERVKRFQKICEQISRYQAIFAGVIYILSRLIILVLPFTCLRAVSPGVYQNTPWTRFLPSFS
jgi:hypothetical protein